MEKLTYDASTKSLAGISFTSPTCPAAGVGKGRNCAFSLGTATLPKPSGPGGLNVTCAWANVNQSCLASDVSSNVSCDFSNDIHNVGATCGGSTFILGMQNRPNPPSPPPPPPAGPWVCHLSQKKCVIDAGGDYKNQSACEKDCSGATLAKHYPIITANGLVGVAPGTLEPCVAEGAKEGLLCAKVTKPWATLTLDGLPCDALTPIAKSLECVA